MSLLGLGLMTSCSNDDEVNGAKTEEGQTVAQISISVASASSASTRTTPDQNTGEEADATAEENNVKSLTVVLADENDIAQQVINPELKDESAAKKEIRSTKPFTINAGKYKVYVLANYTENKDNLSPVIIGSTNMKQTFDILGTLSSTANNGDFFMSNADDVKVTDFTGIAGGKEVDDDGGEVSSGKTLFLLEINLERAVSKVTFDNTDEQPFDIKDGDTKIATAVLKGVSLINLNKKMFLVKEKDASISPGTSGWTGNGSSIPTDWFYVKDPNYSKLTTPEDISSNFGPDKVDLLSSTPFTAPGNAALYCPENTMVAEAQLNGQTTGVVYKVTYTPNTTGFNPYTTPVKNGTDAYSALFTKVLALESGVLDSKITEDIFTASLETSAEVPTGSFYAYKGLLFKNKNAAYLYCAIDANLTTDAATAAAAVNTDFKGYDTTAPADVHLYEGGVCYYTAWIKHNPNGTTMEQGKYGTVRNHWYVLAVTKINGLGHYAPTYKDAADPDDPAKALIQVKATVKKWTVVKQDVTLE